MTSRAAAPAAAAAAALALTAAQDVVPGVSFYHTWQYALVLAALVAFVLAALVRALRGTLGVRGKRLVPALAGGALAGVAGLASGLLGPDTANVVGTPGTVSPIPALGAAAFFGAVDADGIARGDATIVLRRRGDAALEIAPSAHRLARESVLSLEPQPAAFIDATDEGGAHLTITQPTNASFLSPVLLFRARQRIGELNLPLDTFATPGRSRVFRALYFTPRDLAGFHHAGADAAHPALVLTAADERGRPLGITLVPSGKTVTIAGVRIRATLGTYPALSIAAAPPGWALALGIGLFAGGIGWSVFPQRGRAAARVQPAES